VTLASVTIRDLVGCSRARAGRYRPWAWTATTIAHVATTTAVAIIVKSGIAVDFADFAISHPLISGEGESYSPECVLVVTALAKTEFPALLRQGERSDRGAGPLRSARGDAIPSVPEWLALHRGVRNAARGLKRIARSSKKFAPSGSAIRGRTYRVLRHVWLVSPTTFRADRLNVRFGS
jgi:hypothetical protein